MKKTTLCLIDDHKIVRQGLKGLLERMDSYEVIHEFDSGVTFLESLPLYPEPDLYILDYSMPFKNGIEVLQELGNQTEHYKVLLLTQHFDEAIIDKAYYHGARGFLHKNCTAQELKSTIDTIVQVGYNNVMDILNRVKSFESRPKNRHHDLSERELQFLALVCDPKEYTYDQMADIMGLSVKSVEAYRAGLFDRFDIKSKVGLVLFSYHNRLTPPFIEE